MSYCRWSTSDYKCDLYCYGDVYGGYTTHVATNRVVLTEPLPEPIPWPEVNAPMDVVKKWSVEYSARENLVIEAIRKGQRVPIDLPFAGQSFNDPDLESFLARLLELKKVGYIFPDDVIDTVREEIEEEKADPSKRKAKEEEARKNIEADTRRDQPEGKSDEQK